MREIGAFVLVLPGMVFKCERCGNLHGARVDACGVCGSGAVALLIEAQGKPCGDDGLTPEVQPDLQLDFTIAAIDLMRAATTWFRQGTPTERDPLRGDKFPGSGQRIE
jgi:hypothetical protein